eukprot:tig00000630_g2729.t1
MAPSRGAPSRVIAALLWCLLAAQAALAAPQEPGREARRQFAFGDASASSAQKFLFFESDHPFVIPLVINVGLIGFEVSNNGALNFTISSSEFESLLQKHLPTHQPSVFESQEPLRAQYQITYNVVHINAFHLRRLEEAIRGGLRASGETGVLEGYEGKRPIYDVDVAAVEEALDRAYMTYFGYTAEAHTRFARQEMFPYAVMILNPAKPLFAPPGLALDGTPHPFLYRYFHKGAGPTQSWLAKRRYVAVDLSAGPVQYGPTRVSDGTVSHRTVPRVDDAFAADEAEARAAADAAARGRRADFPEAAGEQPLGPGGRPVSPQRRAGFLGQAPAPARPPAPRLLTEAGRAAGGVVATAVEYVFAPTSASTASRRRSACCPAAFRLNASALEAALARLALPGQTLSVVAGPPPPSPLSPRPPSDVWAGGLGLQARTTSTSTATSPSPSPRRRGRTRGRRRGRRGPARAGRATRVDGATLAHELAHAADLLAGPLIGAHQPALVRAASAAAKEGTGKGREAKGKARGPGGGATAGSLGTRVRPRPRPLPAPARPPTREAAPLAAGAAGVRVQPRGAAPDALIDGASPVHATHDMVLVLQAEAEAGAPLPFFAGGGPAGGSERPVRQVLRHAVAGAAASLGALVAPFERYSPAHRRPLANYLFAHGEHPFGPFSNSTELSDVLVDHVGRNALLARLHAALGALRAATHRVDHFAAEYVYDASGELVAAHGPAAGPGGAGAGGRGAWLERLYHAGREGPGARCGARWRAPPPLAWQVSQLLYGFRLEEAGRRAASLLVAARGFHAYALQQLAVAAADVRCCSVRHQLSVRPAPACSLALRLTAPQPEARRGAGPSGLASGPLPLLLAFLILAGGGAAFWLSPPRPRPALHRRSD